MSETGGVATCDHCGGPDRDGYPLAICGTSDPDIIDGCKDEFVVCHRCHLLDVAFAAAKMWRKGHACAHAADVVALRAEVDRLNGEAAMERAATVAWLNGAEPPIGWSYYAASAAELKNALAWAADEIEKGAHRE